MREPCHRCREEAEAGLMECRYCWRDLADLIQGSGTESVALDAVGGEHRQESTPTAEATTEGPSID
jgi:hypothetical protein